jgi:hypothetical protein
LAGQRIRHTQPDLAPEKPHTVYHSNLEPDLALALQKRAIDLSGQGLNILCHNPHSREVFFPCGHNRTNSVHFIGGIRFFQTELVTLGHCIL